MYSKIMELVKYTEETNKKLIDIAISLQHITGIDEEEIQKTCFNKEDLENIKTFIKNKLKETT